MREAERILFVCVKNAGRSQMGEAFARKYGINASSAGTVPSERVNPMVVQAMKERGVDLSSNIPKMLTLEMIEGASLVVTMGCSVEEVCPRPMLARMQKKLVDWHLEDPRLVNSLKGVFSSKEDVVSANAKTKEQVQRVMSKLEEVKAGKVKPTALARSPF